MREVPSDMDGKLNARHLRHYHVGNQEIGSPRPCGIQGNDGVIKRSCVETLAHQNEFESRSDDTLVINHKHPPPEVLDHIPASPRIRETCQSSYWSRSMLSVAPSGH